jgi:hypothetical protein
MVIAKRHVFLIEGKVTSREHFFYPQLISETLPHFYLENPYWLLSHFHAIISGTLLLGEILARISEKTLDHTAIDSLSDFFISRLVIVDSLVHWEAGFSFRDFFYSRVNSNLKAVHHLHSHMESRSSATLHRAVQHVDRWISPWFNPAQILKWSDGPRAALHGAAQQRIRIQSHDGLCIIVPFVDFTVNVPSSGKLWIYHFTRDPTCFFKYNVPESFVCFIPQMAKHMLLLYLFKIGWLGCIAGSSHWLPCVVV